MRSVSLRARWRQAWGAGLPRKVLCIADVPKWAAAYSYADDAEVEAIGGTARMRGLYTRDEFLAVTHWKTRRSQSCCARNSPSRVLSAIGRGDLLPHDGAAVHTPVFGVVGAFPCLGPVVAFGCGSIGVVVERCRAQLVENMMGLRLRCRSQDLNPDEVALNGS